MYILLSGADFRDNNVGREDIQIELSSYAEAAVTASGRSVSSLTRDQIVALNSFFALQGGALWDKLERVYLPIIGNDLSKAFVNYVNASFLADVTPSADYFEIRNHGIAPKNSTEVDAANGLNISGATWNWGNLSVMVMQTENVGITDGNVLNVGVSWYGSTHQRVEFSTATSASTIPAIKGYLTSTMVNTSYYRNNITDNTPCLRGISTNGTNCHLMLATESCMDSNLASITPVTTTGTLHPYATAVSGQVKGWAKAMGVLIIGEYLTTEEMLSIQSLVADLYTAFNV